MELVVYGLSTSRQHTDVILTALHAAGFGPSNLVTSDQPGEAARQLSDLGVPREDAAALLQSWREGGHLVALKVRGREYLEDAREGFRQAAVADVRVHSGASAALRQP